MKIYLDTCSLQRPFDDQKQIRIATETEAILGVLSLWDAGIFQLVASEALKYELTKIPSQERRAYMEQVLAKAEIFVDVSLEIEKRAADLVGNGVKPLDALHLACAEVAKATYFCTSDDRFLKKAKMLANATVEVVSPMELVIKLA